jgi:hypothetical protein
MTFICWFPPKSLALQLLAATAERTDETRSLTGTGINNSELVWESNGWHDFHVNVPPPHIYTTRAPMTKLLLTPNTTSNVNQHTRAQTKRIAAAPMPSSQPAGLDELDRTDHKLDSWYNEVNDLVNYTMLNIICRDGFCWRDVCMVRRSARERERERHGPEIDDCNKRQSWQDPKSPYL